MIIHTCIIIIPNLNNYTITRTVLFNNDNDSNNNNNNLNQDNLDLSRRSLTRPPTSSSTNSYG